MASNHSAKHSMEKLAAEFRGFDRLLSGTSIFSRKSRAFDAKAAETIEEINRTGCDGVEVHDSFLEMEPQDIPAGDGLFLAENGLSILSDSYGNWKSHSFGYGIWRSLLGFAGFKKTYVYRNTNWVMDVYYVVKRNAIKTEDIFLCHVFQTHGNYDPRPQHVPNFFDFDQIALNHRIEELEAMQENPMAFIDYFDECNENSGAHFTRIANVSKRKRSPAWENFTEIKVLGPKGELVLTLAICHRCNMAYKTGGLKPKCKGSTELVFRNNGTKTLEEHKSRCSGHQHIAGNPQGVLH